MKYFGTISAIVISGLIISGCSSKNKNASASSQDPGTVIEKAAVPVKIIPLAKTKIGRTVDYTATILPFEEVNMAPSTS